MKSAIAVVENAEPVILSCRLFSSNPVIQRSFGRTLANASASTIGRPWAWVSPSMTSTRRRSSVARSFIRVSWPICTVSTARSFSARSMSAVSAAFELISAHQVPPIASSATR